MLLLERSQSMVATASQVTDIGIRVADPRQFDQSWYLQTYPDVARAGIEPVQHYLKHGVLDGRNPNRSFDTNYYLSTNPDVARAGIHPFLHYALYGHNEGRAPNALAPRPTRALRPRSMSQSTPVTKPNPEGLLHQELR